MTVTIRLTLDALREVGVALVDVGPGIDDPDDRLALPIDRRVAHLHEARTVAERAQVVRREPACTTQGVIGAAGHGCGHPGGTVKADAMIT